MDKKRIFKTPEDLLKTFTAYKADVQKRSKDWQKIQYVGKDGKRAVDNLKVPLTLQGFKRFCWDSGIGHVEQYFVNKDDLYDDFIDVCARIKNEINEDIITGGMLNVYNPSISARLTGLAEKTETTTTASIRMLNIDPLDDSSDNQPEENSGTA